MSSRNASLVIDRYVMGGGGTAKNVTLKLLAGSPRFMTGHSDKRAYRIITPQGTIGVRGTVFDMCQERQDTDPAPAQQSLEHLELSII